MCLCLNTETVKFRCISQKTYFDWFDFAQTCYFYNKSKSDASKCKYMPSSRAANKPNLAQSQLTSLASVAFISWWQNDTLRMVSHLKQGVVFSFFLLCKTFLLWKLLHLYECTHVWHSDKDGESYCRELCDFLTPSCNKACGSVTKTETRLPTRLPHSSTNFFEKIPFARFSPGLSGARTLHYAVERSPILTILFWIKTSLASSWFCVWSFTPN